MQIQISWLLQKPTDLDLYCLQRQGISRFSRTRIKYMYDSVQFLFFFFTDDTPPTIVCPPLSSLTLYLEDSNDTASLNITSDMFIVNDDSGIQNLQPVEIISRPPTSFTFADLYKTYTFTATVRDQRGNAASCQAQVFVTSKVVFVLYDLTLVLVIPDMPCLCKQCRSRSVGFWRRNQLIWICTAFHSVLYGKPRSSNLIGSDNKKCVWNLNVFSMTRVKRMLVDWSYQELGELKLTGVFKG